MASQNISRVEEIANKPGNKFHGKTSKINGVSCHKDSVQGEMGRRGRVERSSHDDTPIAIQLW